MINKVYLSGVVTGAVLDLGSEDQARHATFSLAVTHRTRKGEEKQEVYPVNAWNGGATWCLNRLKPGMAVALQGYLAQRILFVAGRPVTVTEVQLNEVAIPAMAETMSEEATRDAEELLS